MSQARANTAARALLMAAGTALAVIALLVVAAAPSLAAQGDQVKKAGAKQSDPKKVAAKPAEPPAVSGQRAYKDPITGKLREPEPGEAAALVPKAKRTSRTATATAQRLMSGPGGEVGMVVPEEAMSYSVATLNPDGTVSMSSVTGKAEAEAIVKSHGVKKTTKKGGHTNDR